MEGRAKYAFIESRCGMLPFAASEAALDKCCTANANHAGGSSRDDLVDESADHRTCGEQRPACLDGVKRLHLALVDLPSNQIGDLVDVERCERSRLRGSVSGWPHDYFNLRANLTALTF